MKATATATYAYGLLERKTRPAVERAPAGLPGLGPLRALPVSDGLWLLAAPAPLARYGAEPIERGLQDLDWVSACALGHERVGEHFLGQGTLLPMKLFTLFTSEAAAVAHSRGGRPAGHASARAAARPGRVGHTAAAAGRRGARQASRREGAERPRVPRAQGASAGARARRTLRRPGPRGPGPEDAAKAGRRARAQGAAGRGRPPAARRGAAGGPLEDRAPPARPSRRQARALAREGMDLVLTGPWPAYHFLGARR